MKSLAKYLFPILFVVSCSVAQNNDLELGGVVLKKDSNDFIQKYSERSVPFDSVACGLNFKHGKSYSYSKSKIAKLKIKLKTRYFAINDSAKKELFLDSVSNVFADLLLNEIIPYWYGTTWSFEGYTAKPNNGQTGCSYFVSTTLKHTGLNVNRYKLAQQNPHNEAKSLAITDNNITENELFYTDNIKDILAKYNDGLYFVGLSNHVGFFYVKEEQYYFIHSNYIDLYVMIEYAQESGAFVSDIYYFSKISGNKQLALSWIMDKEVVVIRK